MRHPDPRSSDSVEMMLCAIGSGDFAQSESNLAPLGECEKVGSFTLLWREVGSGRSANLMPVPGEPLRSSDSLTDLLEHTQAIESVCRLGAVLPVRYGWFRRRSSPSLHEWIAEHCEALRDLLNLVAGCFEFEVKVYAPELSQTERDAILDWTKDSSAVLESGNRRLGGREYLESLAADHLRRKTQHEKLHSLLEPLTSLARVLEVLATDRPIAGREIAETVSTLYSALYLVTQENAPSFRQRAEFLKTELHEDGRLVIKGPRAPYGFAATLQGAIHELPLR